ncbi:purple acid phosphatase 6 isoform X1 [Beta vulgaris subsp. vulgaris]|uniref:purple acid phosphatase 6 isoform X1 n=1 Tax=Beta vulgaris subsp. vulgaris TaxID=3555 RepID=UPI00203694AD|nr:purple acid phosphatase 6 isoform X1 [Beta vulgaris subsp. vulgaris]
MPAEAFPSPSGYNAPEQVHITQGDRGGRGVIISWVTPDERHPDVVRYWSANDPSDVKTSHSQISTYRYYNYSSGYIHHATIRKLEYDTKYYYELGKGDSVRQFSFTTPPRSGPDVPYTFGIMGDLGQTYASNSTLGHYMANPKGQTVLFVGDLSYADDFPQHDQRKWDSWGRFIENSAAYQPWIWTAGNHELDFAPEIGEYMPFKPYLHRYHVPYKQSGSASPLWYSIKRGPAYIIVLSSYSAFTKYTPQYNWFQAELEKVDRHETPWLIVLMHTPLYNSDNYHYMEGESMRVIFEPWMVSFKVDLVLAGHVHAYERSERVSNIQYNITDGLSTPIRDLSAPVYITLGDGGNIEGIADNFIYPQPSYSAYREASFGHAMLEIKNRTHAYYTWHRNQDDEAVASDSTWFYNRFWYPRDESA